MTDQRFLVAQHIQQACVDCDVPSLYREIYIEWSNRPLRDIRNGE